MRLLGLISSLFATLLGGLWLLQGLGLVQVRPILCLVDCAALQGPSRLWAAIGAVTLFAGLYVTALIFGAWRWSIALRDLLVRLKASQLPATTQRYSMAELEGLPTPVQNYFRAALTDGQRIVRAVSLTQSGRFNPSATGDNWKPFTATQQFSTDRAGFVWEARIALAPGVPVRAADGLIAGEGLLRPTVLGLFSLGSLLGSGDIARGELLRQVAERVWFPTALLPSQGVAWRAVDESSAEATVSDGPISVTLLFRFDAEGLVSSVHVAGRATTIGKTTVQMPWECRMSNPQTRNGMRLPLTGEALYITPQGERPYFKGTIDTLTHEFAP